jgi:hypothetical protein
MGSGEASTQGEEHRFDKESRSPQIGVRDGVEKWLQVKWPPCPAHDYFGGKILISIWV